MRKKLTPQDVDGFLQQYGRRAEGNHEPNDRQYSRQLEELIKHLDPWELDALMRGEDPNTPEPGANEGEENDQS